MKYPKIIAVAGFKQAGKDTSAEMIQWFLNTPKIAWKWPLFKCFKSIGKLGLYKKISFAGSMKKSLSDIIHYPVEMFEDINFKESWYIFIPTLDVTNEPPKSKKITDNKFSKMIERNDYSFVNNYYITIRQLLQVYGTEIMRNNFNDKIWINSALKSNEYCILSDLRFRAEYDEIKNNNGIVIYIQRDSCKQGSHSSEREVVDLLNDGKFDYTIHNNSTKKQLFYELRKIFK